MMIEMATPKEEWLAEYSRASTRHKYEMNFDAFCEWAKTSDVELVKEYKASDHREFSKKWGSRIVQYYNDLIREGAKVNTARAKSNAPRAFFRSQTVEVKIKRGAIGKARMAMGEHEFILEEFQKMFRVGDIEDKAKLATALNLGWGAGDFVRLEWSFIEPFLNEELEPPVAFWAERHKTGAVTRAHLTHEALSALRELRRIKPKAKYVFEGRNGTYLTEDALNDWLKSLRRRAKIKKRGKIRFHLIRKFTFSQLSASGMNQFESKLCVGKSIPNDILTYLKGQEEVLREKFMNAEPRLTLSGMTNGNHTKLGEVTEKIETLETIVRDQEKELQKANIKVEVLAGGLADAEKQLKEQRQDIVKLLKMVAKLKKPEIPEDAEETEET